tara:strand:- start:4651 stop:5475 length:825 start_codon:yes stop_codon:yes gene_type:complete
MNDKEKNINEKELETSSKNIEKVDNKDDVNDSVDNQKTDITIDESNSSENIHEDNHIDEDNSESKDNVNMYAEFLIGKKVGMTSIYDSDGEQFPATIIEAGPCFVSQIKSFENDGYTAVQIGFVKDMKANKPRTNHFNKSGIEPLKHLSEFRVSDSKNFNLGEELNVNVFNEGDIVKISGTSKGKGFAGVMKRHGFGGGRASHGKNSVMRKPGSVGAGADPSRIWKGKKMPGRYGGTRVTSKGLEILKIDKENNLLFVKGSVPGANNGLLTISR